MGTNVIVHGKDSTEVLQNDSGKPQTSPVEVTNNRLHVDSFQSSSVYGNYPETLYDQTTAQAGDALDNTIFGTINDMSMYAGIMFINTAANVTCEISLDGTTFIVADHPFIDMGVVARTIVAGTNTNIGPFLMNTPCKGFRFRNEGAAQASVTYALVGSVQL